MPQQIRQYIDKWKTMESKILESKLIQTPKDYAKTLASYFDLPTREAGNLNLKQFFELMYYMLDIQNPGLVFAPAWPQYLIPSTPENKKTMDNPTKMFADTVTYMVTRKEPTTIGGDKQPFGSGSRELTPRPRETQRSSDEKSRLIFGQRHDNLIQFDLWTLTNFEAENLAHWFERFMTVHRGFLKHMGLSEILFWWRGRDDVSASLKNNLHLRTLVYFVRTEEISYEDDFNLKELQTKIEKIMR